jgi:CBS domain-containing protein
MPISECSNIGVVCCEADATVPAVAALMRKHHVGDVLVVEGAAENRMPLGIITDRDIVIEAVALDIDTGVLTAGDLMSAPLVTIAENAGLVETLRVMRNHKIRRMPVVTPSGSLYGIVTADDIMNLLAMEMSLMTAAIVEQPLREGRMRK